ncbi:hypothetical protein [Ekhidna sp.]|jgi:hypothetical protein|uniref:hypothetical protein n=1 Tax=Ekhidna sp. TaxID=2608089 RepID=UPI0032EC918E
MNKFLTLLLLLSLSSCYKTLSIDGFDKERWVDADEACSTYRQEIVDLIIENQDVILEGTQNEVESLLGKAKEHELYDRNQKFFHYRLTPPDTCGNYETIEFLSIRFNAIGRANLVQVMLREPQ